MKLKLSNLDIVMNRLNYDYIKTCEIIGIIKTGTIKNQ